MILGERWAFNTEKQMNKLDTLELDILFSLVRGDIISIGDWRGAQKTSSAS